MRNAALLPCAGKKSQRNKNADGNSIDRQHRAHCRLGRRIWLLAKPMAITNGALARTNTVLIAEKPAMIKKTIPPSTALHSHPPEQDPQPRSGAGCRPCQRLADCRKPCCPRPIRYRPFPQPLARSRRKRCFRSTPTPMVRCFALVAGWGRYRPFPFLLPARRSYPT